MKGYQITQFGIANLATSEMDKPKLGMRDVLVRMRATSLNYRDLMMIEGTYNPKLKLPLVPFSDGAGDVVEIGTEVTRWKIGDRVCPTFMQGWIDGELDYAKSKSTLGGDLDGCLREFGAFHEDGLVRIPDVLSYEEAACLPCAGVTAWNALMESGGLKQGETVLLQGTGGVSMLALQFAKLAGARTIVISSSNEKLERAKALGADEVINYRENEDWDSVVLDLTKKRGVDHVVEIGGAGTLARSIRAARIGGHIAVIGVVAGTGEISHVPIFMKALRVIGVFVGSCEMFENMNAAIDRSGIKPVIGQTFGFDEVREALSFMKSGEHFGKIVVSI
jgi:NADPH:quinone reductase-like Zn-dependent oxidoreductase